MVNRLTIAAHSIGLESIENLPKAVFGGEGPPVPASGHQPAEPVYPAGRGRPYFRTNSSTLRLLSMSTLRKPSILRPSCRATGFSFFTSSLLMSFSIVILAIFGR
jgi:hypothetical protein